MTHMNSISLASSYFPILAEKALIGNCVVGLDVDPEKKFDVFSCDFFLLM